MTRLHTHIPSRPLTQQKDSVTWTPEGVHLLTLLQPPITASFIPQYCFKKCILHPHGLNAGGKSAG